MQDLLSQMPQREKIKAGFSKGRERYKCKDCGCNYTVELKSTAKPESMKKQVLRLYLEYSGFCSIGRLPGVSNVSVLNRIRKYGKEAGTLHLESIGTERAEADEMHTYAGSKNCCRIWIAVDGHGKRFLDFVSGSCVSSITVPETVFVCA
ncbi:Transposase [Bacteroidales bacterium Barb4]|nr:Transposase [Bacteroidales bacterium Barb4]